MGENKGNIIECVQVTIKQYQLCTKILQDEWHQLKPHGTMVRWRMVQNIDKGEQQKRLKTTEFYTSQ